MGTRSYCREACACASAVNGKRQASAREHPVSFFKRRSQHTATHTMRDTPSVDPVRVHIALWTGLEDTQVTFLVAGVCFFLFVVVGWCVRHCVAPRCV